MDWSGFNANFARLARQSWRDVNRDRNCGLPQRVLRLWMAFLQQRRGAILDFDGKLRALSKLPLPPDPDIVHFGAEAGWEAAIIQALFGDGGRVLLIDSDPMAYERYLHSPRVVRARAPRGSEPCWVEIRRDTARFEYAREDFFRVQATRSFDVGIDWGLIEHYDDAAKQSLIALFRRFLRPGGLQICACPRDRLGVRLFYRAFAEELNLGYRELMTLDELAFHVERSGCRIEASERLAAHNIVAYRVD